MSDQTLIAAPDYGDIVDAAARLEGQAIKTPLLTNHLLDNHLDGRIFIKNEALQRTGSFKFRGAYNCLSQLSDEQRANGVIAYSSGNHAQGVAAAARELGISAFIVMPEDAPAIKLKNTRSYGAKIITYDRVGGESREDITHKLSVERGLTLIRPYDDANIIAGQGTVGKEMVEQAREAYQQFDAVLVNCGGGGLAAGCALAIKELSPATKIYLVEPAGFDDTCRSFETGERMTNDALSGSICDALLSPSPGEMTFAINQKLAEDVLVVTDDEVREAMSYAFTVLKIVLEPGGAASFAALLSGKVRSAGKTIGVVGSGGNVDPQQFSEILSPAQPTA